MSEICCIVQFIFLKMFYIVVKLHFFNKVGGYVNDLFSQ